MELSVEYYTWNFQYGIFKYDISLCAASIPVHDVEAAKCLMESLAIKAIKYYQEVTKDGDHEDLEDLVYANPLVHFVGCCPHMDKLLTELPKIVTQTPILESKNVHDHEEDVVGIIIVNSRWEL